MFTLIHNIFLHSIIENNTQKTDVQNKYVAKQHTEQQTQSLDLKLNISNSEIVLIEDTSQWDTNAVIFKVSACNDVYKLF